MILSDLEIWMEIGSERLRSTPSILPRQVTPSSVDLRLANEFTTLPQTPPGVEIMIDSAMVGNVEDVVGAYGEVQTIPDGESFILRPGDFVLAYTLEHIAMPNYLAARVE
jgi:dCTP deaminase